MPFPSPGDLSDTWMEPGLTTFQADFFFYCLSYQGTVLGVAKRRT